MIRICFVCLGNICRSPMAEFIMKKLVSDYGIASNFFIESRGCSNEELGNSMHIGTTRQLDSHHIPYTTRTAQQLQKKDYEQFDYFIGMDQFNIQYMRSLFQGDPKNKVYRLLDFTPNKKDVLDPWYTNNFDETYQEIMLGCQYLVQFLSQKKL